VPVAAVLRAGDRRYTSHLDAVMLRAGERSALLFVLLLLLLLLLLRAFWSFFRMAGSELDVARKGLLGLRVELCGCCVCVCVCVCIYVCVCFSEEGLAGADG
jgi:hypothetical protein